MTAVRTAAVLVALQLLLVGVYLGVEARRTTPVPFAVETLDEPAPTLELVRGDATVVVPTVPHLVHFWATWCAPCQVELPALIAAADEAGVPLLAITEEPWPVVERYFDGRVPGPVVRDPSGEAGASWRVSGLPDTFVVRDGRVVGRMGGPRAWESAQATAFLRALRRDR